MATTVTIPLNTLTVGSHEFGPAPVDDAFTSATLMIDRTVSRPNAEGFNLQPATTKAELVIEQSNDGGATWLFRASAGIIGGLYAYNEAGDVFTFSDVTVEFFPGTGRRARATVVVTGARVAVAGTMTIT